MNSSEQVASPPDNSNQSLGNTDLLGENAKEAGDDTGAGDLSLESDSDKNNTGTEDLASLKKSLGTLRQQSGEQRKRFLAELAQSAPERLEEILREDETLRIAAEKQGITAETLAQKFSAGMKPTEEFLSLAKSHNLNKEEAEKAFAQAKALRATGISQELAIDTAFAHFSGGVKSPSEVPTQGGSVGGDSLLLGKVPAEEYMGWDTQKQREYKQKFGNNPNSFLS